MKVIISLGHSKLEPLISDQINATGLPSLQVKQIYKVLRSSLVKEDLSMVPALRVTGGNRD